MIVRRLLVVLGCAALVVSTGCTTRYQDLLRDRDGEIRELTGRVSQLRATNDDLAAREAAARKRAEELQGLLDQRPSAQPTDAALSQVQNELGELDVRYQDGRLKIGIENSVTFDAGSIALKQSSHSVLRRVAGVLKDRFASHRIYVEGHTDSDPIEKTKDKYRSNRHLSAERADAVARFLVGQAKVPVDRVVVVGFGQFDPVDRGKSEAAKARNRRVEIVVGDML